MIFLYSSRPDIDLDLEIDFDHEIDLDLSIDLDLDPMILTYEHDLRVFRIYLYSKNKLGCSRHSKVID